MLGPLEDLLADPHSVSGEESRSLVEIAHRNALRLLKLVNSLLDFSRLEAGRARANFEPVDLAVLTAELAANFRSAAEKFGLKLEVETETLDAPVYVDRDMWEKVVLNLLSNAFYPRRRNKHRTTSVGRPQSRRTHRHRYGCRHPR
jgi:signal transduction histidine kinase